MFKMGVKFQFFIVFAALSGCNSMALSGANTNINSACTEESCQNTADGGTGSSNDANSALDLSNIQTSMDGSTSTENLDGGTNSVDGAGTDMVSAMDGGTCNHDAAPPAPTPVCQLLDSSELGYDRVLTINDVNLILYHWQRNNEGALYGFNTGLVGTFSDFSYIVITDIDTYPSTNVHFWLNPNGIEDANVKDITYINFCVTK